MPASGRVSRPASNTSSAGLAPGTRGMKPASAERADAGREGESTEIEVGLILAHHAFSRWSLRCMAAAGRPELSLTDVLALQHVRHRDRPKTLSEVCFALDGEDTHVISYALRKLVAQGLLSSTRLGKEVAYAVTDTGRAAVDRYSEIRSACLMKSMAGETGDPCRLADSARVLRALAGLYDQAARAAASL